MIRPVKSDDMERLTAFFTEVISHTFFSEGLYYLHDDITDEIKDKLEKAMHSLTEKPAIQFFIAEADDMIIGTVSINPRGAFSKKHLPIGSQEVPEIASLYIKPTYQSMGIGKRLLHHAKLTLQEQGYQFFILDSGYKQAQKIWRHLLGAPEKILKNFWGSSNDHMFWYQQL
ncbi:MAG TPA: GNAT family N-acetyltransferase [Thermotogota bacterium]|nr:GNAT family N-acetyltransferase [Thermotogota bacterium]HRW35276.1 GNAT family N-acetyltransferase [Thermotogota bacterium]